jgi:hypothetical protein
MIQDQVAALVPPNCRRLAVWGENRRDVIGVCCAAQHGWRVEGLGQLAVYALRLLPRRWWRVALRAQCRQPTIADSHAMI